MFAAVLLTIVIPSSATLIFAASASAAATDSTIARTSLLNTVLTDEKPRAGVYGAAPTVVQRAMQGKDIPVAIWTEPGVLRAATAKEGSTAGTCMNPAALDPSACLTSGIPLPATAGGIATKNILAPGTAGALYDFAAPAGATELRYVFKAATVPGASEVIFGNRDHPEATHRIAVVPGQDGYYLGRIIVTAGDRLTLSTSGPATFAQDSFLVYEAPR